MIRLLNWIIIHLLVILIFNGYSSKELSAIGPSPDKADCSSKSNSSIAYNLGNFEILNPATNKIIANLPNIPAVPNCDKYNSSNGNKNALAQDYQKNIHHYKKNIIPKIYTHMIKSWSKDYQNFLSLEDWPEVKTGINTINECTNLNSFFEKNDVCSIEDNNEFKTLFEELVDPAKLKFASHEQPTMLKGININIVKANQLIYDRSLQDFLIAINMVRQNQINSNLRINEKKLEFLDLGITSNRSLQVAHMLFSTENKDYATKKKNALKNHSVYNSRTSKLISVAELWINELPKNKKSYDANDIAVLIRSNNSKILKNYCTKLKTQFNRLCNSFNTRLHDHPIGINLHRNMLWDLDKDPSNIKILDDLYCYIEKERPQSESLSSSIESAASNLKKLMGKYFGEDRIILSNDSQGLQDFYNSSDENFKKELLNKANIDNTDTSKDNYKITKKAEPYTANSTTSSDTTNNLNYNSDINSNISGNSNNNFKASGRDANSLNPSGPPSGQVSRSANSSITNESNKTANENSIRSKLGFSNENNNHEDNNSSNTPNYRESKIDSSSGVNKSAGNSREKNNDIPTSNANSPGTNAGSQAAADTNTAVNSHKQNFNSQGSSNSVEDSYRGYSSNSNTFTNSIAPNNFSPEAEGRGGNIPGNTRTTKATKKNTDPSSPEGIVDENERPRAELDRNGYLTISEDNLNEFCNNIDFKNGPEEVESCIRKSFNWVGEKFIKLVNAKGEVLYTSSAPKAMITKSKANSTARSTNKVTQTNQTNSIHPTIKSNQKSTVGLTGLMSKMREIIKGNNPDSNRDIGAENRGISSIKRPISKAKTPINNEDDEDRNADKIKGKLAL